MSQKPIVIIGAGIGGLSTAIRLRCAGKPVIVLEKNAEVGGKMNEIQSEGFRWDTGPSVITMLHVFEDLFKAANRSLSDYLTLLPVEPLTRYFYPDGVVLDVSKDIERTTERIAALDARDVEGYRRYLKYAADIHRVTGPVFIYNEPPTLSSFARVPIWDWLKADPFRTMDAAIRSHVHSPHLRQLLGRFATYVGGSPFQAPATLNVIADVELNGGVWYPKGGIYQIARALKRLAEELGAEIHCGAPVSQILIRDGRAAGVTVEGGEHIAAEAVIANADVTSTISKLLPERAIAAHRLNRINHYEQSCSGFVLLLGVRHKEDRLVHHNIFFSRDYRAEFDAIFQKKVPPPDPTIYLAITSKTDPEHAPAGAENWFILVNAPSLTETFDWSTEAQAYRDLILAKLAERGFDIRSQVEVERILTPKDLEQMSGAWRGALYGPSANKRFTVFLRPHNRSQDVRGLYFVGGTTHPGGGVPMVMLSAKICARMVLNDLK